MVRTVAISFNNNSNTNTKNNIMTIIKIMIKNKLYQDDSCFSHHDWSLLFPVMVTDGDYQDITVTS